MSPRRPFPKRLPPGGLDSVAMSLDKPIEAEIAFFIKEHGLEGEERTTLSFILRVV